MKTFHRILQAALLGAATCTALPQSALTATSVEVRETPPPIGKPQAGRSRNQPNQILRFGPEGRAFAMAHSFGPEKLNQPLIIRSSKLAEKTADEIREDMAVMARILEKASADHETESQKVLGLDIVVHGGRSPRNIYLEDYGLIFTVNVNIPLKGAPQSNADEKKSEKESNVEWESARNEIFGLKQKGSVKLYQRAAQVEFDEDDVKRLRDELIESLRNAANIRNLKDDLSVTIVVRGRAGFVEDELLQDDQLFFYNADDSGESTMVIKARKNDIDSFAKKSLSKEDFRKRVTVNIY